MSKKLICELMSDYFDNNQQQQIKTHNFLPGLSDNSDHVDFVVSNVLTHKLPVVAKNKLTWQRSVDPIRLIKTFEFKTIDAYRIFLIHVCKFEENLGHHAKLIADYPTITVEIYTRDVNDITDLDIKYAHEIDRIFKDVKDYREHGKYSAEKYEW